MKQQYLFGSKFSRVLMASVISASDAAPVEINRGFFVEDTLFMSGISMISNEAILYAGVFRLSKSSQLCHRMGLKW